MNDEIDLLSEWILNSNNIVFFGGAGVSTASNIPDFRSSSGLFSKIINKNCTPEQLVSHSFFLHAQEEFFQFYREKLIYPNAKPNHCHIALAKLERIGKLKGIVTQNIDGLHQMAGSNKVYELHGSIHRNCCTKCHKFYDVNYILKSNGIPKCYVCGGVIKPDVVLYEEELNSEVVSKAIEAIANADMLIIGGTSLVVYPAASFIEYFKGDKLIVINKSSTHVDYHADLVINDNIDKVLYESVCNLNI